MSRKSQLKSQTISKVWLNKKDYKFLDFDFKIKDLVGANGSYFKSGFKIEVYNCDELILILDVTEINLKENKRFKFQVEYFNPKTDNDCYSINHIIAVCSEYAIKGEKDIGNADVFKNKYVFRLKSSYYSYVKIWCNGKILNKNYDKELSYEFATEEYISYIKKIFDIKKMYRRRIKGQVKDIINRELFVDGIKKL